jgi:diacylglycerol kinase family enzyme
LLEHGKMIEIGRVNFSKPVVVIYNPNSGKKRDVRLEVIKLLNERQIGYELYETRGYLDAFNFTKDLDYSKFSAIVTVGGDGTIHEVVNGMMFREDDRRLPIALIPNGSGNDTCSSLGIKTIEQALSFLNKGDILKIDVNRVLVDSETISGIPADANKHERLRYSIINAGCGFSARVVHKV